MVWSVFIGVGSFNGVNVKKYAPVLIIASMVAIIGHVIATQLIASALVYNPQFLGEPLIVDEGFDVSLYFPHKVYLWANQYKGGHIDAVLYRSVGIAVFSLVAGFAAGVGVVRYNGQDKLSTSHGSSRWATEEEVKARKLTSTPEARLEEIKQLELKAKKDKSIRVPSRFSTSSVVIGRHKDGRTYFDWGPEHVMVFAPTRSGKGVGLIIPTLLTWSGSVVVTDLKGENYLKTSHYRKKRSHIIYFNPTDPFTACWNPLLEVRRGSFAPIDAGNISGILLPLPTDVDKQFWAIGGQNIITATILYVLYNRAKKTLGEAWKLVFAPEDWVELLENARFEDEDVAILIEATVTSVKQQSDDVRSGWFGNAQTALALWKDANVRHATSKSDFRLQDFQFADRPLSCYLVIPPDNIERLSPLIRLFFTQLTDALTQKEVKNARRLLMLCDEFPAFGQMKKIEKAMAYTASYGIKWFIICQGLMQLDRIYGENNEFLANCHTRLAYPCNEEKTALRLSKLLGTTTNTKIQKGQSGKAMPLAGASTRSSSDVEHQRDLMTPGELMQFGADRILIMQARNYPIKGYKVTYYDDPLFLPKYKEVDFPKVLPTDFPHEHVTHDWETPQPTPSTQTPIAGPPGRDVLNMNTMELDQALIDKLAQKIERAKQAKQAPETLEAPVCEESIVTDEGHDDEVIEFVPDVDAFSPSFLVDDYQGKENIATSAIPQDVINQIISQDQKGD